MAKNKQAAFPMNGGSGTYSYSNNSTVQREASMTAKVMIEETIATTLDIEKLTFSSSSSSKTFCIADLGCSVGPNTCIAVQQIIDAVEKQIKIKSAFANRLPEFQVFFNDQIKNDFNTLFTSLPPERRYFAAGVPGSFHGQLFPNSTIHIAHASFAFHWLSEVPGEVMIKDSPSWNKGRIVYIRASDQVVEAYAAQFAKDMASMLNARANEIVPGGIMLALMVAFPDGYDRKREAFGLMYDTLASCLLDMAHQGCIDEDEVDSFNLPLYVTSPEEMASLVAKNGCFNIVRSELLEYEAGHVTIDISKHVAHIRAATEGQVASHFGAEIIDELFDRFDKKAVVAYRNDDASGWKGVLLFLALQRE